MESDIFKRNEGLVDVPVLARKTVVLIGLGSVGAGAALWLAKSGVGNFRLVDYEKVAADNVCRHIAGLSKVGCYKTEAAQDVLDDKNPSASVQTFETDITNISEDERDAIFSDADLIIASTDSNLAQFTVNQISLSLNIPAIYIGCYERASGGEIVYVIPGETPCFNCAFEARTKNLKPVRERKTSLAYTSVLTESQADRFEAEPGLAVDIDYITVSAMPYALALLDPRSKRRFLLERDKNVIFISSGCQPHWIFEKPFSRILGKPERGCSICEKDKYYGFSEEEALEKLGLE